MPLPPGDSQLIQIMDAALADAALRAGPWLACKPGCTQCCHGAFSINALDALRLETGMKALHAADPSTAEAVEQRARNWIAKPASWERPKKKETNSKSSPTTPPAPRSTLRQGSAMFTLGVP